MGFLQLERLAVERCFLAVSVGSCVMDSDNKRKTGLRGLLNEVSDAMTNG